MWIHHSLMVKHSYVKYAFYIIKTPSIEFIFEAPVCYLYIKSEIVKY